MAPLAGFQRKYLRGIAHHMRPVVTIGKEGLSPSVLGAVETALDAHELIKVKFADFKEKEQKHEIASRIETGAHCEVVGMIGHVVLFFRQQPDPERRKVQLPGRMD
ncbi:MAG: ribosome assembly RNA-binding protein YhbY [Deltaproteobacteria bacterium]|nr:ribosome assembly RNA-binding protein YhbY [Deltaproteobacteria bacterium]MBW1950332.1 ribosome assembly RNA-binding protein YhbY [Deltaproteobacteria bacterium]MBW2008886.1 ribosome assembly RNA-binding protein YhbY [Deltaproteobacteria bacterium]MBW2104372.1 ribosome assembly RNA-binding protein YhbY [Deltaproteobacteria bacterium]MBW2348749.1 ribosome assembly RNA-binding protein YhbY [Deltaproteobacteria bacterium]